MLFKVDGLAAVNEKEQKHHKTTLAVCLSLVTMSLHFKSVATYGIENRRSFSDMVHVIILHLYVHKHSRTIPVIRPADFDKIQVGAMLHRYRRNQTCIFTKLRPYSAVLVTLIHALKFKHMLRC